MNQENSEYLALLQEAESENTSGDRLKELAKLSDELAKIAATNISASAELLHALAFYQSRSVKKAVIGNSNASIETLLELGIYFPKEILNNRVFQYYAARKYQEYDLLRKIAPNVLHVLIQQNAVPQFILTQRMF